MYIHFDQTFALARAFRSFADGVPFDFDKLDYFSLFVWQMDKQSLETDAGSDGFFVTFLDRVIVFQEITFVFVDFTQMVDPAISSDRCQPRHERPSTIPS